MKKQSKQRSKEKQLRDTCIYKLRKMCDAVLPGINKRLSTPKQQAIGGLAVKAIDDIHACLSNLKEGKNKQLKIYLRVLFETICLLNYLALNNDDVTQEYIDYSRVVTYKDLLLSIKYELLSRETTENGQTLGSVLDDMKIEILEKGWLKYTRIDEKSFKADDVNKIAANINSAFRSVAIMKSFLREHQMFSNGIDSMYYAMYNLGSQAVHAHYHDTFSDLIREKNVFTSDKQLIRKLNTSITWVTQGLNAADMFDGHEYKRIAEQSIDVINTIRTSEGELALTMQDLEVLADKKHCSK